jgi:hypothetical protein
MTIRAGDTRTRIHGGSSRAREIQMADKTVRLSDSGLIEVQLKDLGAGKYAVMIGGDVEVASFPSDLRTAVNKHRRVTLNATPSTPTPVAIPDSARGIRIYPQSNDVRFGLGESPPAAVATADWGIGSFAKADQWEVRVLPTSTGRELRLISTVASVVVDLEVF